jgi:hypothetical protein
VHNPLASARRRGAEQSCPYGAGQEQRARRAGVGEPRAALGTVAVREPWDQPLRLAPRTAWREMKRVGRRMGPRLDRARPRVERSVRGEVRLLCLVVRFNRGAIVGEELICGVRPPPRAPLRRDGARLERVERNVVLARRVGEKLIEGLRGRARRGVRRRTGARVGEEVALNDCTDCFDVVVVAKDVHEKDRRKYYKHLAAKHGHSMLKSTQA